eukprot:g41920.t1
MAPRSRHSWLGLFLGLVLGFALASRLLPPGAGPLSRLQQRRRGGGRGLVCGGHPGQGGGQVPPEKAEASDSRLVYVGVMSAKKYLRSRAIAAQRTWAQHIPGRVEFFSSEGSDLSLPLPLVALPG